MVSFYLAATPRLKVRTGNPARPPLFSGEAHCLVSNICIFLDGAVGSWRHCSALVAWRRPSLGKARWLRYTGKQTRRKEDLLAVSSGHGRM